jgi:hypothetical protein
MGPPSRVALPLCPPFPLSQIAVIPSLNPGTHLDNIEKKH